MKIIIALIQLNFILSKSFFNLKIHFGEIGFRFLFFIFLRHDDGSKNVRLDRIDRSIDSSERWHLHRYRLPILHGRRGEPGSSSFVAIPGGKNGELCVEESDLLRYSKF